MPYAAEGSREGRSARGFGDGGLGPGTKDDRGLGGDSLGRQTETSIIREDLLDELLRETFPASDAISGVACIGGPAEEH